MERLKRRDRTIRDSEEFSRKTGKNLEMTPLDHASKFRGPCPALVSRDVADSKQQPEHGAGDYDQARARRLGGGVASRDRVERRKGEGGGEKEDRNKVREIPRRYPNAHARGRDRGRAV